MQDRIHIVPSYSLDPSKIVSFNTVYFRNETNPDGSVNYSRRPSGHNKNATNATKTTVVKKFHNFKISVNARRNLRRKINWLYFLSRKQKITTYRKKTIYNFRIGFHTLTLPSKQIHPTSQITNEILNPFLQELRKRTKMENYVWRLEFQKNGNVHYHMVTDAYCDYHLVKKIWNTCAERLGYVSRYRESMQNLTLNDYHKKFGEGSHNNFRLSAIRYAKGVGSNWSSPNSTDVKSVIGEKQISNYISKYFGKDENSGVKCNQLDHEGNSKSIRLWYCSRSLSKLNTVSGIIGDMFCDVVSLARDLKGTVKYIAKYAVVWYINMQKMHIDHKKLLSDILRNYAFKMGYFSSS